jgi:hypothetical protein
MSRTNSTTVVPEGKVPNTGWQGPKPGEMADAFEAAFCDRKVAEWTVAGDFTPAQRAEIKADIAAAFEATR